MKRILLLVTLAIGMVACSKDDPPTTQNQNSSKRYQKQVVNGVLTSNTRPLTDPNSYCGEITETGTIQNVTYYWITICE
jgi:hypothetical protein